jgi:peptidyl-tRNA hydrolase, PTH2 family
MESDFVIYLLVRKDLKMGLGKTAAQCGHAVQNLLENTPRVIKKLYWACGYPKIVLKVDSEEELMDKWRTVKKLTRQRTLVIDAGKTQLPADTPTVIGIGPLPKKDLKNMVQDLKLL